MTDKLWAHFDAFLSVKKPLTGVTYRSAFKLLCKFLNQSFATEAASTALINMTEIDCIKFISWLKQRNGTPRYGAKQTTTHLNTISHKLMIYNSVFTYFKNSQVIKHNPWEGPLISAHMRRVKPSYAAPMIPFDKVNTIIELANEEKFKGLVDKAILCLFLGGALRLGEVCDLCLGDIMVSAGGTIYLRLRSTKSGGEQDQGLPDWAGIVLANLVKARKKQGASNESKLFVRRDRDGHVYEMSRQSIVNTFKRYVALSGVYMPVSPHSARATAITRLLDCKVPYRHVQEFSRHASISSVEKYDRRSFGIDAGAAKKLKY